MFREIDDTTSDIALEVFSDCFFDLVTESGKALCSEISDLERIKQSRFVDFQVSSNSIKELMHDFLSAILTHSDIEDVFFSSFVVMSLRIFDHSGNKLVDYDQIMGKKESNKTNEFENVTRELIDETDLAISLDIRAYGEDISREKSGIHVKGITYYDFLVCVSDNKWHARFVCDV